MQKALSCEGLAPIRDFEELVGLASRHGFTVIDAGAPLVRDVVERLGIDGVRHLLDSLGVRIGSFPSSAWWVDSWETFLDSLSVLIEDAKLYRALGCEICHTFIMPSCDDDLFTWTATATSRIRLIADILAQYDIRLALEYVGPHHMRKQRKNEFIYTAKQTLNWIRLIERSNVGLLLDAFHWYTAGETEDDLQSIPSQLIFHVHINDAPQLAVEEITDNNRLFPGEGVINLKTFMNVLRKKNYDGIVAQEVLQLSPPLTNSENLAKKSKRAFELIGL